MQLTGRTAIVTGAARGIGHAVAAAFLQEGATVVRVDRAGQFGSASAVKGSSVSALDIEEDLRDPTSPERIINRALEAFGRIDVLVNCAQAATQKLFVDTTDDDWALSFETGFWPTVRLMQHAFASLRQTKGSVINFASGAGIDGQPTQAAYGANKEAIRGLSRVVANEWAPLGIRVNVVAPFALSEGVKEYFAANPAAASAAVELTPLGRVGDLATDIAPAVVFLASNASQYITGQTLMVDGGQLKLR